MPGGAPQNSDTFDVRVVTKDAIQFNAYIGWGINATLLRVQPTSL